MPGAAGAPPHRIPKECPQRIAESWPFGRSAVRAVAVSAECSSARKRRQRRAAAKCQLSEGQGPKKPIPWVRHNGWYIHYEYEDQQHHSYQSRCQARVDENRDAERRAQESESHQIDPKGGRAGIQRGTRAAISAVAVRCSEPKTAMGIAKNSRPKGMILSTPCSCGSSLKT